MIAVLSHTPGLADAFHTAPLGPWLWLSLAAWPPLVLGAEELRKAVLRRRDREAKGAGPPRGEAPRRTRGKPR
jgi:hypothetical protein